MILLWFCLPFLKIECRDGFVAFQTSCYQYHPEKKNFRQARKTCRKTKKTDLVTISSQEENDFLNRLKEPSTAVWLGAQSNSDCTWTCDCKYCYRISLLYIVTVYCYCMYIVIVHRYCRLLLYIVSVYCYCILSLYSVTVHRYCILLLYIVTVYCYCMYIVTACILLLYIATVYFYCTLLLYIVTVYRYCILLLYIVTVNCYCILLLYIVTVYCYCTSLLYIITKYH